MMALRGFLVPACFLTMSFFAQADYILLKNGQSYGGEKTPGCVTETEESYVFRSLVGKLETKLAIPKAQVAKVEFGFDREVIETLRPGEWDRYFELGRELGGKSDALARSVGHRLIRLAIKRAPEKFYVVGHLFLAETSTDDLEAYGYFRRAILASPTPEPELLEKAIALRKPSPPWEKVIPLLKGFCDEDPIAAWQQAQEFTGEEEEALDFFLLQNLAHPLTLATLRDEVKKCVKEKRIVDEVSTPCPDCKGEGQVAVQTKRQADKCLYCNGKGKTMRSVQVSGTVRDTQAVKCAVCNGTGKDSSSSGLGGFTTTRACKKCRGTGKITSRKATGDTEIEMTGDLNFSPELRDQLISLCQKAEAMQEKAIDENLSLFNDKLRTGSYREFDDLDYEKTVFRGCEWAKPEEASEK